MANDRSQIRGTVLVEDRRTERFFRELLVDLGFDKRKITFKPAPSGRGDAGDWVRAQYPAEVNLLRQKRHQRRLFLLAARDGDNEGLAKRKADLDRALDEQALDARQDSERIVTPVPTWSIETWLLALLGDATVDEDESRKRDFERRYPGKQEGQTLQDAAQAWRSKADQIPSVPSLADSKTEMNRMDLS
ncbi:MAG: hypothetical protein ACREA2_07290 [Blastocatellia bacterium]